MLFRNTGILGINARNLLYIRPYNQEKSVEMADDKLKTKAFLSARGVPVPKLLGVISTREEAEQFNFHKLSAEFVLKPNLGYGGQGIIPIRGRENGNFIGPENQVYTRENLIEHIKNILNGNFSINDRSDKAFFERLIVTDELLGRYSYNGLPDIRIIMHNLVPVMAMLRLPTKESEGKANLHQGAVGAGIDLAKGEVTHLLYKNEIVKEIPDRGPIKGLKIPFWDEMLRIAGKAQLASNLGYMGADIAIDKHHGPVLLEINARAGISIQLANLAPLRKRLEKLDGINVSSVEKGIRIAKDMFGYSIEKNIKSISGKKVIGIYEKIEFFHENEIKTAFAFINTSRKKSYLSLDLAKQLGIITSKKQKDIDKIKVKLKFKLGGKKITSIFKIDKNIRKKYQVVIGNRDLSGHFLLDSSINNLLAEKATGETSRIFITNYDPIETDRQICKINNQMKFLSFFRPVNFKEEAEKFHLDKNYNPQFIYKEFDQEAIALKKALQKIKYDESDLGILFQKKINELNSYFDLILARGSESFTELSKAIFGYPTATDLHQLQNLLPPEKKSQKLKKYTSLELKQIFEQVLTDYELDEWRVLLRENMLSKCIVNRSKRILIKKNSVFNEQRVRDLIVHEIETHLLTSENGSRQKYRLFNIGFANYLETQEGLAIHNVLSQGNIYSEEGHKEILTEAIHMAEKMSMAELYYHVKNKGLTEKSATDICFRVKRGIGDTSKGGAFTKDYCYFSGRKKIKKFIDSGGDLKDLYHGKYSVDDLQLIKNISSFKTPPLLPRWLK